MAIKMSEVSSFSSNEARRIDEGGGDDLIQKEKKKKENRYIFHNRRCFDESVCECVCFSLFFLVLRTQSRSSFFLFLSMYASSTRDDVFFCVLLASATYIYIKKKPSQRQWKEKRNDMNYLEENVVDLLTKDHW